MKYSIAGLCLALTVVLLGGCTSSTVEKYFVDPPNDMECAVCTKIDLDDPGDFDKESSLCVLADDTLLLLTRVKGNKYDKDEHIVEMFIFTGISVDESIPSERRQKKFLDQYGDDPDTKFSVHFLGAKRSGRDSALVLGYRFKYSEKRVSSVAKTWFCNQVKTEIVEEVASVAGSLRGYGPVHRLDSEEQKRIEEETRGGRY